jgi:hypothetical protein
VVLVDHGASEIVGRLNAEIGSILSLPEVKKRMEDIAVETASSSPAELAAMTRADADKWRQDHQAARARSAMTHALLSEVRQPAILPAEFLAPTRSRLC